MWKAWQSFCADQTADSLLGCRSLTSFYAVLIEFISACKDRNVFCQAAEWTRFIWTRTPVAWVTETHNSDNCTHMGENVAGFMSSHDTASERARVCQFLPNETLYRNVLVKRVEKCLIILLLICRKRFTTSTYLKLSFRKPRNPLLKYLLLQFNTFWLD